MRENMQINNTTKGSKENLPIDFLIAFVLLFTSAILRLTHYTEVGVFPDEVGSFSTYAYSTISNNWLWSKEAMAQPPLFAYILAISTHFFGGGIEVFRIVSIIFGSLSIWVIYFLGKELFDRRVGILSALLLCFGSFHILYSRIVLLEATLIFFILASVYYFYKSYNKENDIKYAYVCGIFLGLACITKWNALLLYLVFFLFIIWTKKNFRSLFEKKFLHIVLISLLIQLPVWIYLYIQGRNPIYYQLHGRFVTERATLSAYQQWDLGFEELLIRGFNKYVFILIDEPSPATLSLPWFSIFKLISSILLLMTILYYLYPVLKVKASETLIFLYFMVFNIFVAWYGARFEHYLLWALPGFYIMLSDMSFKFFNHIKKNCFSISNFIRILSLTFVTIFVFSYILTGSVAPFVDKGELIGYENQISEIKGSIVPEEAIATSAYSITNYYLNRYGLDPPLFSLYDYGNIDLKMLKEVKPRFIIVSEYYYYSSFITNVHAKMLINKYYKLVSNEEGVLLFERKQELNSNEIKERCSNDEISCRIDHDIFFRSIPTQMTVGKPINVLMHVKNTGESSATFFITLETPDDFIYSSRQNWEIITLDKGESHRTEFTILPIKQHIGELNVTAKISLIKSRHILPSTFIEIDNVSASVLYIKNAFSMEDIVTFIYVVIIIIFIVALIIKVIKVRLK